MKYHECEPFLYTEGALGTFCTLAPDCPIGVKRDWTTVDQNSHSWDPLSTNSENSMHEALLVAWKVQTVTVATVAVPGLSHFPHSH